MLSLTYEHITKRAEREIRDAMQRAAGCEIGSYSPGLAVGEARGALALGMHSSRCWFRARSLLVFEVSANSDHRYC
ncbi:hypothetical protein DF035_20035 [Burkholderia contaminans]|nr:hypothetical protein DF035_20035 [Burkholderia contaminans]